MWKLHNGFIPYPISNMFKLSEVVRSSNPYKYVLPNPNQDYDKRNISYSCPKLWNTSIPNELKKTAFLKSFSKKYKTHLLNLLE